jgi:hypothetical protein
MPALPLLAAGAAPALLVGRAVVLLGAVPVLPALALMLCAADVPAMADGFAPGLPAVTENGI